MFHPRDLEPERKPKLAIPILEGEIERLTGINTRLSNEVIGLKQENRSLNDKIQYRDNNISELKIEIKRYKTLLEAYEAKLGEKLQ